MISGMPETSLQRESSSHSLIRRVQRDDRAAWERLAALYGPVVYEWARQQGLQADDAADVMQDVFAALMKNIHDFAPSGTFRGWMWTVTRNKIHDHFRRRAERDVAIGGTAAYDQLQQLAETPPLIDSIQGQQETSGIHRRALELMQTDFEPQTWQAFWRTTIEGESAEDVAGELGVSKWTIYKAKARVLQRLRDEFGDLL